MSKTLLMKRVIFPTFIVFIGHSHLQYAGVEWEGSSRLRYNAYIISSYVFLKDALSFTYGASFSTFASATCETDDDDDVIASNDISL